MSFINRSSNKHHSESIPKIELMLVQRPQKTQKKKRNRNCVNDFRILGNIVDAQTHSHAGRLIRLKMVKTSGDIALFLQQKYRKY